MARFHCAFSTVGVVLVLARLAEAELPPACRREANNSTQDDLAIMQIKRSPASSAATRPWRRTCDHDRCPAISFDVSPADISKKWLDWSIQQKGSEWAFDASRWEDPYACQAGYKQGDEVLVLGGWTGLPHLTCCVPSAVKYIMSPIINWFGGQCADASTPEGLVQVAQGWGGNASYKVTIDETCTFSKAFDEPEENEFYAAPPHAVNDLACTGPARCDDLSGYWFWTNCSEMSACLGESGFCGERIKNCPKAGRDTFLTTSTGFYMTLLTEKKPRFLQYEAAYRERDFSLTMSWEFKYDCDSGPCNY